MASASFYAMIASDTITFDYADDFVPVTLPAVQMEENPQKD
jgi:hypothetical protein